jgi:ribonuclease HI
MELLAAIAGAKRLKEYTNNFHGTSKKHSVTIFTDSKYLCDNFHDYVEDWKKKGWRKSNGQPVINHEYWKKLDLLSLEFHSFRIRWVKGHDKSVMNNKVDAMAQKHLSKRR